MPKTREQIRAEVAQKIKRFFELRDASGLADYFEEVFHKYLPTEKSDNPNDAEAAALKEEYVNLLKTAEPNAGAKFTLDLRDEFVKRKIKHIIEAAPAMDDFEAKIKNHEIPEAEMYVDDPNAVEHLAAIATIGSKAYNMVKVDEAATDILANAVQDVDLDDNGKIVNTGFVDAYQDEMEKRATLQQLSDELWENSGLDPKTKEKIQKRLDVNAVDRSNYKGFYANEYYVDGSPIFATVPQNALDYINQSDEKLNTAIHENEEKAKTEAANKINTDTYVEFYESAQKFSALMDLQKNIIIPMRTKAIQEKSAILKDKVSKSMLDPIKDLADKEKIAKMTPAELLQKLDDAAKFMEERIAFQQGVIKDSEEIVKVSKRILEVKGTADKQKAKKELEDAEQNSLDEKIILGCQTLLLSNIKEWSEKIKQYNTKSVQDLKDEPLNKHFEQKKAERIKLIESLEDIPEPLANIKHKEELAERERVKKESGSLKNTLSLDLDTIDNNNWLNCTNDLIETKLMSNGGRVANAKEKVFADFLEELAKKSPFLNKPQKFVAILGKELTEKENSIKSTFDMRVKDIKADILAGKVPGVFPKNDEMARAIASDIAYNTTPEGKMLKAIHGVKNQVLDTLMKDKTWKKYITDRAKEAEREKLSPLAKNKKADENKEVNLYELLNVDRTIGIEGNKFGYKVTDDVSKQVSGTVFEQMPYNADRIIRCNKTELESMRHSCLCKLNDIDLYDATIGNMADHAKSMLENLNKTNKADHQNSGSYNKMVDSLKKIADLAGEKRLAISTSEVDALLDTLKENAAAYEAEHTGMFIGKSKGFGRVRLNTSKLLQGFADSSKTTLAQFKKTLNTENTIKTQREDLQDCLNAIDKTALDKGYGALVRTSYGADMDSLQRFINDAAKNTVNSGSRQYNDALNAALSLKTAYTNGDAAKIKEAGTTLKQRVNDYLEYKRNQALDGKAPNAKGLARINAMSNLHLAAGTAEMYAKAQLGIKEDIQRADNYQKNIEIQKQKVLDTTAAQQKQINLDNRNMDTANRLLSNAGVDKMIDKNLDIYNTRGANDMLKGVDKVSAQNASSAFDMLKLKSELGELSKDDIEQSRECISQLVLDKMVQLDHGNAIHKNLKGLDTKGFLDKAKELENSQAFKAAVPENINQTYIKKFLADYDGHGVMNVKNSMESYLKAVKKANSNVNNNPDKKEVAEKKVLDQNSLGKK